MQNIEAGESAAEKETRDTLTPSLNPTFAKRDPKIRERMNPPVSMKSTFCHLTSCVLLDH